MKHELAFAWNDHHIPFQDKKAVTAGISFIKRVQPKYIFFLGDLVDFYSLSKYDKDPKRLASDTIRKEVKEARALLKRAQEASPKAQVYLFEGNHEDRLRRYLWRKAAALTYLDITVEKLLGLKELRVKYITDGLQFGDLFLYHGSIVRQDASYTAKAELLKNGCTGMSGHTHRDGKFTVVHRRGNLAWWENYCMCDLNPEYVQGVANWTHGWSVIHKFGNSIRVEQVPVINGSYAYGGKLYK